MTFEWITTKRAKALKYAAIACIAATLSFAEILGIRPFGSAFFMALVFCGLPYLFAAPIFIAAEMLCDFSLHNVIAVFVYLVAALLGRLIMLKVKGGKNFVCAGAAVVGNLGVLSPFLFGSVNLIQAAVWGIFGVGFTLLCIWGITPVLVKKLKFRLMQTETIAVCVILACFGLGLSSINPFRVELLCIVAVPLVLVSGYLGGFGAALIAGMCLGLGSAVQGFSVTTVAVFVFMALIGCMFLSAPRALSACGTVLAYTMFIFFFNAHTESVLFTFISLCIGAVVYMLIPRHVLDDCRAWLGSSHSAAAARGMINRAKKGMGNNLCASARIFFEMGEALNSERKSEAEFADRLCRGVCEGCDNYIRCSVMPGHGEALEKVMEVSNSRGRASVKELPAFLSGNCVNLAKIISFAGAAAERNHEIKLKDGCENAARKIVSEQLSGMARVLDRLGKDAGAPESFDAAKERLLVEELNYGGVVATEALVTSSDISLLVRTETINREQILSAVKRIMKSDFIILSADADEIAGYTALNMRRAPKFDVAFATVAVPKNKGEKSGDSHSFIKIGSDKFMMALCDGMGSGEEAAKASETAIGLVESFYKAGFDHDLVLESVNKFLSLGGSERYSTLDICVIDLNSGVTDIIKFGSPPTIIKAKDTVRAVEGASLPIGALESATPSLCTVDLMSGEMLIMTSDGVSESFDDVDLLTRVNNLHTGNPSIVANGLLEHTLSVSGGVVKDDSTVLCAKVFARV